MKLFATTYVWTHIGMVLIDALLTQGSIACILQQWTDSSMELTTKEMDTDKAF